MQANVQQFCASRANNNATVAAIGRRNLSWLWQEFAPFGRLVGYDSLDAERARQDLQQKSCCRLTDSLGFTWNTRTKIRCCFSIFARIAGGRGLDTKKRWAVAAAVIVAQQPGEARPRAWRLEARGVWRARHGERWPGAVPGRWAPRALPVRVRQPRARLRQARVLFAARPRGSRYAVRRFSAACRARSRAKTRAQDGRFAARFTRPE